MGKRRKDFTAEERAAAQRAAVKRYYARHREEVKARIAAWKEKNREEVNAKMREWYDKNHERIRTYKKAYYQRNKAKIKAARLKSAAEKAGSKRRLKYKDFTKEAQGRPLAGTAGLNAKQKAILRRIETAITADDIE